MIIFEQGLNFLGERLDFIDVDLVESGAEMCYTKYTVGI
jgi:hypothetical protein